MSLDSKLTASHWGIGVATVKDGRVTQVRPHPTDPDPSPLNDNMVDGLSGKARILRPAIREGWLNGDGERGRDAFVEVSWDVALNHIAKEIERIRSDHGNQAIFGGSYGWASAGRFHHAQSQLKRFLNSQGGFTTSEGNYSFNAALVAMPYFVGQGFRDQIYAATRWTVIAEHTDLVVAFGGLPMRATQICDGGIGRHRMSDNFDLCADKGVRFVNISPLKTDVDAKLEPEWLTPRPGSDTAVMMGLAHTLYIEGLHDQAFLDRYTVGFGRFLAYLTGEADGVVRDADWAAAESGLDAERIRRLARDMAGGRTMISCAAGIQRADWGEQPLWLTVTLAAMLGQIGLPGGGYTVGYAVNGHVGNISRPFPWGAFPIGKNPVDEFIPVAMVSDLLLNPGGTYRYEGETRTFPDIRMVWWAGGNPFHHHQDLNRLREAFQRPDTVIVNELNWTATARHADIVLPIAGPQERLDFGAGKTDNILIPMPKLVDPPGQARTEHAIYSELARRLGNEEAFTEGKSQEDWLRSIWGETQTRGAALGHELPDWDDFISGDIVELDDPAPDHVFLSEFRADPEANPRPTPSGRLEIFSDTVAGFDIPECPGHPVFCRPRDLAAGLGNEFPLMLISGQPATRLHSQFDNGAISMAAKVAGREPVLINPLDAATRGIKSGDVVELSNGRGRALAGAVVTGDVMAGVVFLWTGAWYDPDLDHTAKLDRHGNPNVLTHDLRTSEFSQSPASHSALVQVGKFDGIVPKVEAHEPPEFVERT